MFDSDFLELSLSDLWLYQIAKSREIQEMRGKTDIEQHGTKVKGEPGILSFVVGTYRQPEDPCCSNTL